MIRYVLFDLDNTLYPSDSGMEEDAMQRIGDFVARHLGVSFEEGRTRRNARIDGYGTTLEWLIAEQGLEDVEGYYAVVHPDGEEEGLSPDPALRSFLESLPVKASVLTNAPLEHAERVLRKLDLEGVFEHIFDIRWNGLRGKPAESAFRKVLSAIGSSPEETLFVDDAPSYVEGYLRIGGAGVLLDELDRHPRTKIPRIRSITEISRFLQDARP
ncbi:MAG: pyrimidine 5'-nucleotidase [Treponema sp. RIFOXYC1_FULL_61_9]|nr:MAG: pyrimidine 5'-nucleotidase [Treponema sp. GWA1_62_8]OHE70967.1 MAG: pyrimidine 5'-nucleotidase [Treponema sp. RIFOXYC1_FULL_61_9]